MKITDIEMTRIYPRLIGGSDEQTARLHQQRGIGGQLVYKITTDNGIVGYGEHRWKEQTPPLSSVEPLIGRDPFDFINNTFHPSLGGALYDVMGKHLEVPAYKLMGRKLRDAVTVCAWTPSGSSPTAYAEQVARAVKQGYMVFKIHTSATYDVFDLARAAAEVTPEGFKLHFDFNHSRTIASVLPIIDQIQREHPIVGFIEDPLPAWDLDNWRRLRAKMRIPLVHGGAPLLGGIQEAQHGMADAYMIGESSIGDILARGIAYGKLNTQVIMQHTGGTLAKALALHMASVLPTATGHSINLDDQYSESITTEDIPVTEGFSPVPERPGLGFDVDESAIARMAENKPDEVPRYVPLLHLPGGHKFYAADVKRLTGREEGTIRGIRMEWIEDDGSDEFNEIFEKVEKGAVVSAD